jgi:REP element-mobilizing transposase RayT
MTSGAGILAGEANTGKQPVPQPRALASQGDTGKNAGATTNRCHNKPVPHDHRRSMPQTSRHNSDRFPSYRRDLPHQHPQGFPLFITWNLDGAHHARFSAAIDGEWKRLEAEPIRPNESLRDRKNRHEKMLFAFRDNLLDRGSDGPDHLKDPQAAQIVVDSILFGVPERYDLYAFVVMPNHVHVLFTPRQRPSRILKVLKGYTSYQINRLQRAPGRVLWQHESYDHWARDEEEASRIIEYIENNPVRAGLCTRPQDWPFSSAAMRADWLSGQALAKKPPRTGRR